MWLLWSGQPGLNKQPQITSLPWETYILHNFSSLPSLSCDLCQHHATYVTLVGVTKSKGFFSAGLSSCQQNRISFHSEMSEVSKFSLKDKRFLCCFSPTEFLTRHVSHRSLSIMLCSVVEILGFLFHHWKESISSTRPSFSILEVKNWLNGGLNKRKF